MRYVEIGDYVYPLYTPWWERMAASVRRARRLIGWA